MSLLKHRFERHSHTGSIHHIFDGQIHHRNEDLLEDTKHVSFGLNFYGAPKFKSSGVQLWPVFLVLNELPRNIR